mgnify:CR=1 FL=1
MITAVVLITVNERLLKALDGAYRLSPKGSGTDVTYELADRWAETGRPTVRPDRFDDLPAEIVKRWPAASPQLLSGDTAALAKLANA